jgi:hypothetical protein
MYELEHKLVADRDTFNVIRAICVDRVHNHLALTQVRSTIVVRIVIVTEKDRYIDFRLLNCFELRKEDY